MTGPNPSNPDGGHRLFFALSPPDDVRAALARAVDGVEMFRGIGRRVPNDKLHLTLHFLGGWGERPEEVVDRARAAAASIAPSAFHLVIDHAGAFRGARVGWLAPAGNSGLDALWSELRRALDAAGAPQREHERFSPHVTVLRDVRAALQEVAIPPTSWPVDDFVLVHSHDGRYDIVGRWTLARA